MAKTLIFLRHGKSDWSEPDPDHCRPLAPRGRRQAPAMGAYLLAQEVIPQRVFVSSAVRAKQTWAAVASELGDHAIEVVRRPELYTTEASAVLDVVVSGSGDVDTVAVVGHNPSLADAVAKATGVEVRLPTSALAIMRAATWESFAAGDAELVVCLRPADGRKG